MSDYNNWPVGVIDFSERNPLWRRVYVMLRYHRRWAETEFRYVTVLHGLSTPTAASWSAGAGEDGGRFSS